MLFIEQARMFKEFLVNVSPPNRDVSIIKPKVGFVVTPWLFTAVPWYSITLALLSERMGAEPVIIFDDLGFGKDDEEQIGIIEENLSLVSNYMRIIKLSENTSDTFISIEESEEISRLSYLNAVWKSRTDDFGSVGDKISEDLKKRLIENSALIKSFFKKNSFDRMIVPGGIYGNSGLYLFFGKKYGIRVSTYDSGPGSMLAGYEDVAAYQTDTKIIAGNLNDLFSEEDISRMKGYAQQELNLRLTGRSAINYQLKTINSNPTKDNFDILIPLNVVWDAAALGKHRLFKNTYSWVTETLQFLIENTTATVVIRQHPAENMFREKYNLVESLKKKYIESNRVVIYSCEEFVNTYELIKNSSIVLPHTSTVGIEASILKREVIIESDCYYSEASFVYKANSKDEYFKTIVQALQKDADNKLDDDVLLYYFLSQVCGVLRTNFTPQPGDFSLWVEKDINELLLDRNIQKLTKSFISDQQLTLLNAYDKLKEGINLGQ
ncbi:hypothetical protein ABE504_26185 [Paenibacillus oryzisoli]|uniref:capsular polysaccharide export protein, LipB/KpsS family n=1 Tax=Paenibacillus oryzisoli TaxID=1850517 RepID=UPI003D297F7C